MTHIYESLPNPAGLFSYTLGRLPHQEEIEFALDYLESIGMSINRNPGGTNLNIDWYFPTKDGMSWIALAQSGPTLFLIRQDVTRHRRGGTKSFSPPLVRVVDGPRWSMLSVWPAATPEIDADLLVEIRKYLDDDDEWVSLVEWYKENEQKTTV